MSKTVNVFASVTQLRGKHIQGLILHRKLICISHKFIGIKQWLITRSYLRIISEYICSSLSPNLQKQMRHRNGFSDKDPQPSLRNSGLQLEHVAQIELGLLSMCATKEKRQIVYIKCITDFTDKLLEQVLSLAKLLDTVQQKISIIFLYTSNQDLEYEMF